MSLEAGVTTGWLGLTHGGRAVGIDEFGVSGPGDQVLAHLGLTADAVVAHPLDALGHTGQRPRHSERDGAACPTSSSA